MKENVLSVARKTISLLIALFLGRDALLQLTLMTTMMMMMIPLLLLRLLFLLIFLLLELRLALLIPLILLRLLVPCLLDGGIFLRTLYLLTLTSCLLKFFPQAFLILPLLLLSAMLDLSLPSMLLLLINLLPP